MNLLKIWRKLSKRLRNKKLFFLLPLFIPLTGALAFSDGCDYPVGKPDAVGFYDAQDFGTWNEGFEGYHLGEDWNGKKGGDLDLGESLFSIAKGRVTEVAYRRVWGNVVIIQYDFPSAKYNALYAHLDRVEVKKNDEVERGALIGTIGKGDKNQFAAHLHFEIRDNTNIGIGTGYGKYKPEGYLDPSEFINSHRPPKPQTLTATVTGPSQVTLSWNKSEDPGFEKYEIYRAEVGGGTTDPSKRTQVFQGTDPATVSAEDNSAIGGKTFYYKIFTHYKNGMVGESAEVSVVQNQLVIKLTDNSSFQINPVIDGDFVYWSDSRTINGKNNQKLYFYNLKTKEDGNVDIKSSGSQFVECPEAAGGIIAFYACEGSYCNSGRNIYVYNTKSSSTTPVSTAPKDQITPTISKDGIVVWSDLRNGKDLDLYYLDLTKAVGEVPFVVGAGNQRSPRIWGNKVVWKDSRVGNRHDLYLKEIGSETETLLATNVGDAPADIWENWAVWSYKGKMTLINLETKEQKIIANIGADNPRVNEGKIVYTLTETDGIYIHVYDIESGKDTKINFKLNYASHPFISGNTIVFDHSEKQTVPNMDIYLTNI